MEMHFCKRLAGEIFRNQLKSEHCKVGLTVIQGNMVVSIISKTHQVDYFERFQSDIK